MDGDQRTIDGGEIGVFAADFQTDVVTLGGERQAGDNFRIVEIGLISLLSDRESDGKREYQWRVHARITSGAVTSSNLRVVHGVRSGAITRANGRPVGSVPVTPAR